MGTRAQLATALKAKLPKTYKIIDSPREIGEIEPKIRAAVQIIRRSFEPAPHAPRGQLLQTFEIWAIEPSIDPDTAEDNLDTVAATICEAIDSLDFITWTIAEREPYDDNTFHAYRITATLVAETE